MPAEVQGFLPGDLDSSEVFKPNKLLEERDLGDSSNSNVTDFETLLNFCVCPAAPFPVIPTNQASVDSTNLASAITELDFDKDSSAVNSRSTVVEEMNLAGRLDSPFREIRTLSALFPPPAQRYTTGLEYSANVPNRGIQLVERVDFPASNLGVEKIPADQIESGEVTTDLAFPDDKAAELQIIGITMPSNTKKAIEGNISSMAPRSLSDSPPIVAGHDSEPDSVESQGSNEDSTQGASEQNLSSAKEQKTELASSALKSLHANDEKPHTWSKSTLDASGEIEAGGSQYRSKAFSGFTSTVEHHAETLIESTSTTGHHLAVTDATIRGNHLEGSDLGRTTDLVPKGPEQKSRKMTEMLRKNDSSKHLNLETLTLNSGGSVVEPASSHETSATASVPDQIAMTVVERLESVESSPPTSFRIRLNPKELGVVEVRLSVVNDVVSMQLVAQDDSACQIIERQIDDLRQALSDGGITLGQCHVGYGNSGEHRSPTPMPFADDESMTPTRRIAALWIPTSVELRQTLTASHVMNVLA